MPDIRVLLVDDHALIRQGLRALLDREPGIDVIGEAGSVVSAVAAIELRRPDVVLLDVRLSAHCDAEGLDLCGQIRNRYPLTSVLVLTTFVDDWLVLEAIKQGAKGYFLKDVSIVELVRAIRAVHRGESAFDSHSAGVMVRSLHNKNGSDNGVQQITPREREVLALAARGMSNIGIGQRLYISEATVKFHIANVMRKLNAARRTEAVYAATKIGLI